MLLPLGFYRAAGGAAKKPKPCFPLQKLVREVGSCSQDGRFENCEFGCRFDRGIWEDFAYLDLPCLQPEKMLGVCGSSSPTLHSESINSNARASLCGLGVFNSFGTATSSSDFGWYNVL